MKSNGQFTNRSARAAMQRPTIAHVAEVAGVSRAAVSLVLNKGSIRISEAKRKAIQAAARDLGYRPHTGARRLSHGMTETISLIFPYQPLSLSQWFIYEITHHIADQAQRQGYDLLLEVFGVATAKGPRSSPGRVDASIVICDQPTHDAAFLQQWQEMGHPVVVIGGNYLPEAPRDFVDVDLTAGTQAITRHLLQEGHRDLAFIAVSPSQEKVAGYCAALAMAGITTPPTILHIEDHQLHFEFERLMQRHQRPTALVAANDALALRLLKEAWQWGLSVPGDLSVTGFDDVEFSALSHPPLTTVAFPAAEVAKHAVESLVRRIRNPKTTPVQLVLEPKLALRESTGTRGS